MSSPKVFISHAQSDASWARRFADALRSQGIDVWVASDIPPGAAVNAPIEHALRSSDAIVAVLTASSRSSPNVFFELGVALASGKLFIPVVSDDVEREGLPSAIRSRQQVRKGKPEIAAREVAVALRGKAA